MALAIAGNFQFDRTEIENIILQLGDIFEIRIQWTQNSTLIVGVCTVVGGLIGGRIGGKVGTAVGGALGAGAGVGTAIFINLRKLWNLIRNKLQELAFVIYNDLRQNGIENYGEAFRFIMTVSSDRERIVRNLIMFIIEKLGVVIVSQLGQASPSRSLEI